MRRLLLSCALLVAGFPALARENHAILIGANAYTNLDERWWLKGPSNDVELVRDYLTGAAPVPFAAENVTVLADGVEGAPAPTLQAIRDAFAALEARVAPGDFVYLHFSGHGTQAPAADPDSELDGLDEMFLPVDIGPWEDSVGHVQNGLVDDEIGVMIDALRAKGADVWAVFDSCHSGTVTRAAPDGDEEVRTRQLPPEALGLDPDLVETATRALPDPRAAPEPPVDSTAPDVSGEDAGAFVAFFAAQTNEVTPEKRLPRGKPDRKSHGVFTFTLMEVLAEYPQATYGQIAQEVLRKYAVQNLAQSTPLFEGDLDRVAFSGQPGERVAQWPVTQDDTGLTIPAGSLHGLSEGEELALLPSAVASADEAIARLRVTAVDTFAATLAAAEGVDLPADLPKGLVARRLGRDLDFTLTIALPEGDSAPAQALAAAMEGIAEEGGPRLSFVPAGEDADLRLAVLPDSPRPDAIWILPGTGLAGDLSVTPSVSTGDKTADELALVMAEQLAAIARATNLLRLGAAVGAGNLDVDVTMLTKAKGERSLRPLETAPVPVLLPDDEVHVEATNNTDGPVDLNVLYVAADYSISHWFAGRLQPGDTLKQGLFRISDSVLGQERMVVVMTPAAPQTPVEDLSFLAQPPLQLTRQAGTPAGGLAGAMAQAGFLGTTRGAVALGDDSAEAGPAPGILQLEVRTRAADGG